MSDIKYAFYNSTKGYKVVGGTAAQFLKADGSVDGTSYVPVANVGGIVKSTLTIISPSYATTGILRLNLGTNSYAGYLKIKLTGSYASANVNGYIEVTGGFGGNTGAIWNNSLRCVASIGFTRSAFYIDPVIKRDATDGQYYVEIHKKSAPNNQIFIEVESRSVSTLYPIVLSSSFNSSATVTTLTNEVTVEGEITAQKFIKTGGTSTQFLKADGSIDSNSYALTTQLGNYYTKTEAGNQFVGLNTVQTIYDTKTFNSSPVIPNGTLNSHAVNLGQLANYMKVDGVYNTPETAKTNVPLSVTNWAAVGGNFIRPYGTSLHIKGGNPWHYRIDFPTDENKLEYWSGINTTAMTKQGYIPIIPTNDNVATTTYVSQNYVYTPGGFSVYLPGVTDLNTYIQTGFFRGWGLTNAPYSTTDWWFIAVEAHDTIWTKQTVSLFNNPTEKYTRHNVDGSWSAWVKDWTCGDFDFPGDVEVVVENQELRTIPYEEVFYGASNLFETRNRVVKVISVDGGALNLKDSYPYQEITIMNVSVNDLHFTIDSGTLLSVGTDSIPPYSSATYYVTNSGFVVRTRMDLNSCEMV